MNWFEKFVQKLVGINTEVITPTIQEIDKDIPIAAPFGAIALANISILDDILGAAAGGVAALGQTVDANTVVKVGAPAAVAILTSPNAVPAGHVVANAKDYIQGAQEIVAGRAKMLAALKATS
jgi:hypothetical protein